MDPMQDLNERLRIEVKHRSLVLLVQTEIGMLHNFVKFRQWKGRQRETKSDQE